MSSRTGETLRIEGLTKRFGGITALHGVSFSVRPQAIVAIIGPNGAGKTTLFNLISGFHRPDHGRVYFEGHDITSLGPEQIASAGVVRTFQIVRLFNQMTALENVLVGFHLNTRGGFGSAVLRPGWLRAQEKRIREEAEELLARVSLAGVRDTPAGNLTCGQQRLLEIARALAVRPKLLMLDEPAAGLNTPETNELLSLIRRIRDQGLTVVLVEHDMNLVMSVADQIHVLNFGERIASGAPQQIQAHPGVIEAYLGGSPKALNQGENLHV
jgi:branched-chain amino acid transport system ATP-binding protein